MPGLLWRSAGLSRENVDNHVFPWKNIRVIFCRELILPYFCTPKNTVWQCGGFDSVAQLVEQYTFNVWVLGSSPSGITKKGQA